MACLLGNPTHGMGKVCAIYSMRKLFEPRTDILSETDCEMQQEYAQQGQKRYKLHTEEPPVQGQLKIEKIISGTNLMVRPWTQSGEIEVRPDCKEDSILSLLEQVLFSLGGRMEKRYPTDAIATNAAPGSIVYSPMLMVASTNENLIWNEITLLLGVNQEFRRILFINIGSNRSLTYPVKQTANLSAFSRDLIDHIYTALESNGMVNNGNSTLNSLVPDGVIDLGFIRDLHAAVAQNMNERLTDEVWKVDEAMKSYELKCARLMTLLKPIYLRASLSLPAVPEKVSLASYPLNLKKKLSIRDINAEQCRLSLLRARRNYKEFVMNRRNTGGEKRFDFVDLGHKTYSSQDYDKYEFQVAFVLNDLQQQIVQWSAEEYGVRIQRKIVSVKDRFEALRRFKIQLLLTLHDRFMSSTTSNSGILESWGFSTLSSDKKFQQSVQEKFTFLDESQPILVDAVGQVDGKKGSIYLTLSHILSYATSALLGGIPVLVVIPFSSIKTLELQVNGRLLSSVTYPPPSKEPASPSKARITTKGPENFGGSSDIIKYIGTYALRILDFADNVHDVVFLESTADFAVRVFDMMDFILKEKLHIVTEYQPSQRRQFMRVDDNTTVETSLEDLGDMLEITFEKDQAVLSAEPASISSNSILETDKNKAIINVKDPADTHSEDACCPLVDGNSGEAQLLDFSFVETPTPKKDSLEMDIFASMTVSLPPQPLGNELQTSPRVETPVALQASVTPMPAKQPNKRLASNIQKFLQQSQQQKS